jgi:tRNA wybutosine-synthesizing protein 1
MKQSTKQILERQHYRINGDSAIQICRWTKKALMNEGFCYKQKFYGIQSHRCCQMSPCAMSCQNQCLHCWRPIELNEGIKLKNAEKPEKIIEDCIEMQRKLLMGFKGHPKVTLAKFNEAMNPNQFAISLSGEPTLYPHLGKLIGLLRKRKITSFLVTNGLNPDVLNNLGKKKQLPTQLYVSVNAPNEELFNKITRSKIKNAWQIYLKTLKLLPKLKTRKVLRLTLVKDLNMEDIQGYANLIKIAKPDFVEVKGFMSVGFSRQRLGYDRMPFYDSIKDFAKKLAKMTNLKILDEKTESCVVLLGKSKKEMGIRHV